MTPIILDTIPENTFVISSPELGSQSIGNNLGATEIATERTIAGRIIEKARGGVASVIIASASIVGIWTSPLEAQAQAMWETTAQCQARIIATYDTKIAEQVSKWEEWEKLRLIFVKAKEKFIDGCLVNDKIAADKQTIAAADQKIAAADQKIAAADQKIAADKQAIAAADQKIAADKQAIAAADQKIAAAERSTELIKEVGLIGNKIALGTHTSADIKRMQIIQAELRALPQTPTRIEIITRISSILSRLGIA